MSASFASMVLKEMRDLISEYGLEQVHRTDDDVLLKAGSYDLRFSLDRDGVSAIYFDKNEKPPKGYNVLLYLVHKRRSLLGFLEVPEAGGHQEWASNDVKVLARHLRAAARDILRGDKSWLKEYSWPPIVFDYQSQRQR